jgi:hypothetical protein
MLRWQPLLTGLIVLGAWGTSSCSPADFQSSTVIDTMRILASRASEPRAKPGDEVTLDVLAVDGRNPGGTAQVFWLPVLCVNPANDAYYACFATLAQAGGDAGVVVGESADAGPITDAGASAEGGASAAAGLAGLLRPGVNLTPLLVKGPGFRFAVPDDVIVPRKGIDPSYGLIIAFNFACTGATIELLPYDPGDPQKIPVGCFDANHNQLGPDDFVFGFTRVYVYDKVTEVNPVISQVDIGSGRLDIDGGTSAPFMVPLCTSPDGGGCPKNAIGPLVPPSLPDGKQVWADFYSTVGTFSSGARLLYDPTAKLSIPSDTDNRYLAPNSLAGAPAQNFIWIVVHDDQGGADWVTVPLNLTDGGDGG